MSTLRNVAVGLLVFTVLPVGAQSQPGAIEQLAALRAARAASAAQSWAEAARLWSRYVDANPVRAEGWTELGRAQFRLGRYDDARVAYERELELGARSRGDITLDLARAAARRGDVDRALEWLEQSYEAGMRHYNTVRRDEAFEAIRSDPRYRELAGLVDGESRSRDERWQFDIAFLYRAMQRIHHDLYRVHDRDEFDRIVARVLADVPNLTDEQIQVELMRLTRMAGDGHTNIYPDFVYNYARHGAPVTVADYVEGLFIDRAHPEYAHLLGARVLTIGGRPAAEVLRAVSETVARDNDMGARNWAVHLAVFPQILAGLGLVTDPMAWPAVLELDGGERLDIELPVAEGSRQGWVSLYDDEALRRRHAERYYWFEHLPERRAVYFKFNRIFNDEEPLDRFTDRLFAFVEEHAVENLVIDMRDNGGGNLRLAEPLVHILARHPTLSAAERVFVLIGRRTFSAAMITAARLQHSTRAVFVGEPTGSSPNFVGELVPIQLPYSGLEASISNLYWQGTHGADYRTWIAPEIYVPESIAALRAGVDEALEAIWSALADPGDAGTR